MKNLIILSIISIFFTTHGVKNDYLRIEYVGNALKPMRVLWISKKPLPDSDRIVTIEFDDFGSNCVVHNDEFLFIKKTINSTAHKTFEEKDYNGFKITIRENDAYVYYFITRKNSTSLFLKTSSYLKYQKKNKDLIHELYGLRKGNVFDDAGNFIWSSVSK